MAVSSASRASITQRMPRPLGAEKRAPLWANLAKNLPATYERLPKNSYKFSLSLLRTDPFKPLSLFNRRVHKRVRPRKDAPVEVQIVGDGFIEMVAARDISIGGLGIHVPHTF